MMTRSAEGFHTFEIGEGQKINVINQLILINLS